MQKILKVRVCWAYWRSVFDIVIFVVRIKSLSSLVSLSVA